MQCPVCRGSGELTNPKNVTDWITTGRRTAAKELRRTGFSLREIAKLLHLKSQNSVVYLLKS